jgi:N-acyl-D-aspartate/D-glutamate deacylase
MKGISSPLVSVPDIMTEHSDPASEHECPRGRVNDLVIHGGWVIDGTGREKERMDLAVRDGVISEMEVSPGGLSGRRVIDASDLVVAPGFVDLHTHYDAQLFWDPAATPSSLHGVTTVIGGNCGFTLAPITGAAAEYLVPMLSVVEGMPIEALVAGLTISWESFGEFLGHLDGKVAINAGFLVGHSAIRRVVMGERAVGEVATETELSEMVALLEESLRAGALGFSTSGGEGHVDHFGDPVPSRHSSTTELLALCEAVARSDATMVEVIPTIEPTYRRDVQLLLTAMSLAARRPLFHTALMPDATPEARRSRLEASEIAAAAGARVVGMICCEPRFLRFTLARSEIWETVPGWSEVMRLSLAARIEALGRSDVRGRLRAGAAGVHRPWVKWPGFVVNDVPLPGLSGLVGRTIGAIAADRGIDPFDAFCDVAVAGDLEVGLVPGVVDDDDSWALLVGACRDPRHVLGNSDAGAHLDTIASFGMYPQFLAGAVRQRGLLSYEEAIALMTSVPARACGLRDRGTLRVGAAADIVAFDPDTIGHGPVERRSDLPGGAVRLFTEPFGVEEVIVNGDITVHAGALTGATSGTVLRAGSHTVGVAAAP